MRVLDVKALVPWAVERAMVEPGFVVETTAPRSRSTQ